MRTPFEPELAKPAETSERSEAHPCPTAIQKSPALCRAFLYGAGVVLDENPRSSHSTHSPRKPSQLLGTLKLEVRKSLSRHPHKICYPYKYCDY